MTSSVLAGAGGGAVPRRGDRRRTGRTGGGPGPGRPSRPSRPAADPLAPERRTVDDRIAGRRASGSVGWNDAGCCSACPASQLALVGSALMIVVAAGLTAGPAGVAVERHRRGLARVGVGAGAGRRAPGGRGHADGVGVGAARALTPDVDGPRPAAAEPDSVRLDLPGIPGRLRIAGDDGTGAALIRAARGRDRAPSRWSRPVRGRGFLLEDAATQDRLVAGWGRLLGLAGPAFPA